MPERSSASRFVYPLPFGAIVQADGARFSVFSRSATAMRLLLYDKTSDREPARVIDFDPEEFVSALFER